MPRKPRVPAEAQDIGPALVREFEAAAVAVRILGDLRANHETWQPYLHEVSEGALVRYQQARDALLLVIRRGDGVVDGAT